MQRVSSTSVCLFATVKSNHEEADTKLTGLAANSSITTKEIAIVCSLSGDIDIFFFSCP